MRIRVLGSWGAELPGHNLPAFLIDDFLLLDAGTIGNVLTQKEQESITHILLTHAHLDHIRAIAFLADNILLNNSEHGINIISGREVIEDLRSNIFNDRIWPDFTRININNTPLLSYHEISTEEEFNLNGYRILPVEVNHSVAAYGYIIEAEDGKKLVYTGDTGPTEGLWESLGGQADALFIEVSFPDSMKELALKTGHLTPSLLREEIKKITNTPSHIYITHVKPQYKSEIEKDLAPLAQTLPISLLEGNEVIVL